MRTISAALQAHLDGELTTLAELIKLTRTDGVVLGLTTHDVDLSVDGVVYRADAAFSPQSLSHKVGLKADEFELAGILDSAAIDGDAIRAGRFDHARIDVFVGNWADLTQGVVQVWRGWLGEVTLAGGKFVADLRGLRDLLQRRVGDCYTPECRYDLGESRCGVNVASLTVTGVVTAVTDNTRFSDCLRGEGTGYFSYGKLTWTSGANQGLSVEVLAWDDVLQLFTLWLPMPNPVAVGDGYSVYPGCDKRFSTCGGVFHNAANFGGFPHVPGVGRILKYPDAS